MKIMYFIMAGILISSIFVITLLIPQLDDSLRESYFLYSILVVEVLGMWAYRYFQLKEKREEKKTGHTKRLVEKIFKPMLNITIRKGDNGKECLIISKLSLHEEIMKNTMGEKISDDNFYPIDELPYPYYDWAINHMQKYPKLKKSFESLQQFALEIEKVSSEIKNLYTTKIQNELSRFFPDFVENKTYLSNIDSFYLFRNIEKICQIYGQLDIIDPISVKKYVDDKFVLSSNHNGREYLVSNDQSKLDKSKFMELLKNVNSDENITKLIDNLIHSLSKSGDEEKIFKKNLALIVEKLDTGDVLIKGSCEGCS